MKNTVDCSTDNYCYSSAYDLYFPLVTTASLMEASETSAAMTVNNCELMKPGNKHLLSIEVILIQFYEKLRYVK